MTKKLLAAALGLAFAAPVFADNSNVTLYGRVHQAVVNQKYDGATGQSPGSNVALENYASRLGVRGAEDLGGGLSVIFGYEFGVSADNSTASGLGAGRHSYLGVKTNYGTFMAGTLDGGSESVAPLYNQAEKYLGSANNNAGDLANVGGGGELLAVGVAAPQAAINRTQRTGNSFGYKGKFAGVEVIARHALGGANDVQNSGTPPVVGVSRENDFRSTEIAANYKIGALEVGAGFQNADRSSAQQNLLGTTAAVDKVFQIGAKYAVGALTFGGLYARVDLERATGAGRDDVNTQFGLHADYKIGNGGLYGTYAKGEREDIAANAEVKQAQVAYYYDFSKRTRTYVGFNRSKYDGGAGTVERDNDAFVAGVRHNF
jgi:predicted porin